MEFPKRIYTLDEFMKARDCIKKGYRHRLRAVGSQRFKNKIDEIKRLLRTAGYYTFVRTYIRRLEEIGGVGQLREADATIWLNNYLVENPVEGARFIVQKAQQMKDYLEGKRYYETGELAAVEKSIEFLKALQDSRICDDIKYKCQEALKQWTEERVL